MLAKPKFWNWYQYGGSAPPTLFYDFTPGVLPSGLTFTRATTGTDFNSSKVLATYAIDTPRFGYDPVTGVIRGLLIEPSATNYISTSDCLTGWTQNNITASSGQVSPDGTTNGVLLTENTSTYFHYEYDAAASVSSSPVCLSVFAKAGTSTVIQLSTNQTGSPYANFDISSGSLGTAGNFTGAITQSSNSFYRCSAYNSVGASTTRYLSFTNNNLSASVRPSYLGSSKNMTVFGAQIEGGNKPTSYIPTSGSAATRAADVCTFTIPAGIGHLTYTFYDNSTQTVAVSAGSYTIPTNLNQPWIKSIVGSA
ncbi:MAG: hypothetical protein KGL39_11780 [Patescibacteria group bacterium]|nr:hypothetical protein [Patescibacteria group bacterium]